MPRIQKMIARELIIEPIKELYKDEVRQIGKMLGLPSALINRHPFPGPGLAIRTLCHLGDKSKPTKLGWPDKKIKLYKLPIQSVGVQGDERSYAHPAIITSATNRLNWNKLKTLSPQITNKIKEVNRVLVLLADERNKFLSSTPRSGFLTKNRLNILRELDNIVNNIIKKYYPKNKIWQMPIVLLPFGHNSGNSLVLRPVESKEAMTVSFSPLPHKIIKKIIIAVTKTNLIDFIFYDITNKPPGTIEWE